MKIIVTAYHQLVPPIIQNARTVYLKASGFRSQPNGVVSLF